MTQSKDFKVIKPFGPTIARAKMPNELVLTLNNYVDKIINNEKKVKELDHGDKLAGSVSQEFKLEEDVIVSSGYKKSSSKMLGVRLLLKHH